MANYGQFTGPSGTDPSTTMSSNLSKFTQVLNQTSDNLPNTAENEKLISEINSKMAAAKIDIAEATAIHKKATCIEGTSCYQTQTLRELQYKYDKALEVEQTAPHDVIVAKKNLYTFKFSKQYWNEMERNKYSKVAETKYKELINEHNIKNNELDILIDSYSNSLTNQQNMTDYLSTLKTENKELDQQIRKKLSTLNTNERAVWYETHELDYMSHWTYIMFYIYYLLVLVFIYYYITKKLWKPLGYRNHRIDLALLVIFISWGAINMTISSIIFQTIQFFIGLIPIDAYSKL